MGDVNEKCDGPTEVKTCPAAQGEGEGEGEVGVGGGEGSIMRLVYRWGPLAGRSGAPGAGAAVGVCVG